MRKIYTIALSLATLWSFSGCENVESDMKDYFPVVKTISATVMTDGSVQVKGEIVSEGSKPLDMAGFCVDTLPVPKMLNQQAIASVSGNTFTATYSSFQYGTKYYFRSWATNENGYTYGNVISLDSVVTPLVKAPCTPTMNTMTIGSGTHNIYRVGPPTYGSASDWEFFVDDGTDYMTVRMSEKPVTKVYTTTSYSSPGAGQMHIGFFSGFITGAALKDGGSVYVNQTGPDTWEMTICNGEWTDGSINGHMTARFKCPL